jgi:hypothetical protein
MLVSAREQEPPPSRNRTAFVRLFTQASILCGLCADAEKANGPNCAATIATASHTSFNAVPETAGFPLVNNPVFIFVVSFIVALSGSLITWSR